MSEADIVERFEAEGFAIVASLLFNNVWDLVSPNGEQVTIRNREGWEQIGVVWPTPIRFGPNDISEADTRIWATYSCDDLTTNPERFFAKTCRECVAKWDAEDASEAIMSETDINERFEAEGFVIVKNPLFPNLLELVSPNGELVSLRTRKAWEQIGVVFPPPIRLGPNDIPEADTRIWAKYSCDDLTTNPGQFFAKTCRECVAQWDIEDALEAT